jgi:SPP1 family phage portal protein
MNINEIARQIELSGRKATSDLINVIIKDHLLDYTRMLNNYGRYSMKTSAIPILNRSYQDKDKVNNKLNNDYFSKIIHGKLGYFLGTPIGYESTTNNDGLQLWLKENNYEDLDLETIKYSAICGIGARLLYIDKLGKEKIMNLKPYEVIFIYDRSIESEIQYAIRYYNFDVYNEKLEKKTIIKVEWYDDTNITFYRQSTEKDMNGNVIYELDPDEPINPKPHMFKKVPIIPFPNNEELLGDADRVVNLIDDYDRMISDISSEMGQFRNAYLLLTGASIDQPTLDKIKQTGIFHISDPGQGGVDLRFVTKDLNSIPTNDHLERLKKNIYDFSMSVDFTSDQFYSQLSGIALAYKILDLETKCSILEQKTRKSLRKQFEVLSTAWSIKNIKYDNINYTFTRNLPVNLTEEVDNTVKLKGLVSELTRLSQLSFVEDPEQEIRDMEKEQAESVNLEEIETTETTPNIERVMA